MNSSPELALRGASPSLTNSGEPFISNRSKVYVGMSGGVDSSVSALLLKEQGYDVTGVYMKNWSKDLPGMKCPWAEDLADAKRVAVKLGIDFEVWDFENEYRDKVVNYMLSEFKKGNTPNPDIMCNQEIKFKLFFETAMERGADFIATGHYARILPDSRPLRPAGSFLATEPRKDGREGAGRESGKNLAMAVDSKKDQTYFLYRISYEALARTIFPIGEMRKPEVKKLAEEKGLHNAYKKESMGVCFVGEVSMKDFLQEYIETNPGEIREVETEKVVGHHEGAVFYTIGQRHGLYISGNAGEVNSGLPYYVVKKDLEKNIVYVSRNLNNSNIWTDELELKDIILRGGDASTPVSKTTGQALELTVRLRHLGQLIPARLVNNTLHFAEKIKKPAAGQSAVFYDGEICLGGGIII
ncbi:MAG: tRNA 2-thiouridine(34) synthase MnmA [Candidatus Saccharibacteria bacterium]|nr:tRNA 2-thiouridine(34) synthase MnmA [Candidatus Saccharibacteria bacterium]